VQNKQGTIDTISLFHLFYATNLESFGIIIYQEGNHHVSGRVYIVLCFGDICAHAPSSSLTETNKQIILAHDLDVEETVSLQFARTVRYVFAQ